MVGHEDEKWLKKALAGCFNSSLAKTNKEQRLLKSFSLLMVQMLNNTERILDETWALWEIEPTSKELKKKFNLIEKCLDCLKRYCQEKIGHKENKTR